jgi:hypothetical protein
MSTILLGPQHLVSRVQKEKKHTAYIPVSQSVAFEQKCYKLKLILPSEKHVLPTVNICSDPVRTYTCPASRESLLVTHPLILRVCAFTLCLEARQMQNK